MTLLTALFVLLMLYLVLRASISLYLAARHDGLPPRDAPKRPSRPEPPRPRERRTARRTDPDVEDAKWVDL